MKILEKIAKKNLGALLSIFGSSAAIIRLILSTLRTVLPEYNYIWHILTVFFNGVNIIIAFIIIKYNLNIISKNIQDQKEKTTEKDGNHK